MIILRPPCPACQTRTMLALITPGPSGLMSGDGKRGVGHRPQATAPILDFTKAAVGLFDHFVGAEQDGLRDRKAECLCGA